MIYHKAWFTMNKAEQDEIRAAVMLIPEEYRTNYNTLVCLEEDCLAIRWKEHDGHEEEIIITGGTADAVRPRLSEWANSSPPLQSFLITFYYELFKEIFEE